MIAKPVLVTGGTGSLGAEVVPLLLERRRDYGISRIRVVSRNEHKQITMEEQYKKEPVDFFIGDVRDKHRMLRASHGCGSVFHLAAFKSVDKAELDPWESVLTNVWGTHNVMEACQENGVSRSILSSTDKAASPVNCYGAGKLLAEKIWLAGNIGRHDSRFSCCRYGNVLGSNSSVVQKWRNGAREITDPDMTRFFISQKDAAKFVVTALYEMAQGGEVFVPKMKSTTVGELFDAVVGDGEGKVVGCRPGEKKHECLISPDESSHTTSSNGQYIRWPSHNLYPYKSWGDPSDMPEEGFTSKNAARFTKEELRELCSI